MKARGARRVAFRVGTRVRFRSGSEVFVVVSIPRIFRGFVVVRPEAGGSPAGMWSAYFFEEV